MTNYKEALQHSLLAEGLYSNVKGDSGGETYKGIARNIHPHWAGWPIIDSFKTQPNFPINITNNQQLNDLVEVFYKVEHWDKIYGDDLIYQNIANELFDCSINMGITPAVKIFQHSINLLFNTTLVEDGQLGPKTLEAYTNKMQNASSNSKIALLAIMLCLRGQRYIYITEQKPTNQQFFLGWMKRILKKIVW